MDDQVLSPRNVDTSRPSLGFPLGTALLLLIIFCLSGVFSCCYHWDKIRSFRRSSADSDADTDAEAAVASPSSKLVLAHEDLMQIQKESLPVLMPGDRIPKFIAWPCPCEPSPPDRIAVEVQTPVLPPPLVLSSFSVPVN